MKFGLPRLSWAAYCLALAAFYLVCIGLLIQFSIQPASRAGGGAPQTQVLAAVIGLSLAAAGYYLAGRRWAKIAWAGLGVVLILLLAVEAAGPVVFGARRWLLVGGMQLQPSELLKPVLALLNAVMLVQLGKRFAFSKLAMLLGVLAVTVALVLRQPDLSTALILLMVWLGQVVASPIKTRLMYGLLGGVAVLGLLALPLLASYQHGRLQNFIHAQQDDAETSYNVVQARVAIGSGGLTGRGLAGGTQSQLRFLPAQQTDFVFAVVAEKLGFIGAVSVLLAEGFLSISAWRIALKAKTNQLLVAGVGLAIVLSVQAAINLAMNVGLAPVSGLPLPLVSYGGTSLAVSLAMIGWLLGTDRVTQRTSRRQQAFTSSATSVNLNQS